MEPKIKVTLQITQEAEITQKELGRALFKLVAESAHVRDDAGCDWLTYGDATYIKGPEWKISNNPKVAALVNAANVLLHDEMYMLDTEDVLEYQASMYGGRS